jgi:hypothetical protein
MAHATAASPLYTTGNTAFAYDACQVGRIRAIPDATTHPVADRWAAISGETAPRQAEGGQRAEPCSIARMR